MPFPIYTKETTSYVEPWTALPSVLGGFFGLLYPLCAGVVTMLLMCKCIGTTVKLVAPTEAAPAPCRAR